MKTLLTILLFGYGGLNYAQSNEQIINDSIPFEILKTDLFNNIEGGNYIFTGGLDFNEFWFNQYGNYFGIPFINFNTEVALLMVWSSSSSANRPVIGKIVETENKIIINIETTASTGYTTCDLVRRSVLFKFKRTDKKILINYSKD